MIKILFICHGNICRSPMAEFVMKDMVSKRGLEGEFFIASAATSTEAIGCKVHRGTREKLLEVGICTDGKTSVQLTKEDYNKYDYLIAMDSYNVKNILSIIESDLHNKVSKLLEFANSNRDIADPWYTDNFDDTYNDIVKGCEALIKKLGF